MWKILERFTLLFSEDSIAHQYCNNNVNTHKRKNDVVKLSRWHIPFGRKTTKTTMTSLARTNSGCESDFRDTVHIGVCGPFGNYDAYSIPYSISSFYFIFLLSVRRVQFSLVIFKIVKKIFLFILFGLRSMSDTINRWVLIWLGRNVSKVLRIKSE